MALQYRAFLSYSHAADDRLGAILQSSLHRFAKPWYRVRAVNVFRDKTGLAVSPALWPWIERALQAVRVLHPHGGAGSGSLAVGHS